MTGDVRIDTLNVSIGNVIVAPDAIGSMPGDIFDFLRRQINPKIRGEMGYTEVPGEEAEQTDYLPTAEEQIEEDAAMAEQVTKEMVADIARSNHLRNVVHHVDAARKLEGFQTNHERRPRKRSAVDTKQAVEVAKASESLERACAQCVFQKTCRLEGNLERWMDVHPYKSDNSGTRRPGSSHVKEVESREKFLKVIHRDPRAHCDPAKRK